MTRQSLEAEAEKILKDMVENTVMFLTNDLPSLLEQDRVAEIRRFHKRAILKNLPEAQAALLKTVDRYVEELIGEDETLEAETEWYAKTKAHGGTHEEYWRLKAIINNNNNLRAALRQQVKGGKQ